MVSNMTFWLKCTKHGSALDGGDCFECNACLRSLPKLGFVEFAHRVALATVGLRLGRSDNEVSRDLGECLFNAAFRFSEAPLWADKQKLTALLG